MSVLATLDAETLWLETPGSSARCFPIPTWRLDSRASGLFDWSDANAVDVLYVHRSALEALGLPTELEPLRDGEQRPAHEWLAGSGSRASLAPSLLRGEREILIGPWQDRPGDPFEDARDAAELLQAVCAFRDAFTSKAHPHGWTFMHSASGTGWRLMHAAWAYGRRARNLGARLDEAELPHKLVHDANGNTAAGQVEVPYGGKWWRLNPHEGHDLRWTHAYDVNGQRLAACSRLHLGVGPTQTVSAANRLAMIGEGFPGYHLISYVEHPFGEAIPAIFEPGWHTTPRVKMALHLDIPIRVDESIVWSDAIGYLDPFYETFRDARARLMQARSEQVNEPGWRACTLALGALKQAYLQPLGRLRSGRAAARADRYYRPSWYDHVIGRELAIEYLRLHQLAQQDVPVLAVYFDAIVIESDEPDIYRAAPQPLEVSEQLGKYKPIGSLLTSKAHRALLGRSPRSVTEHPGADVGRLMRALKAG